MSPFPHTRSRSHPVGTIDRITRARQLERAEAPSSARPPLRPPLGKRPPTTTSGTGAPHSHRRPALVAPAPSFRTRLMQQSNAAPSQPRSLHWSARIHRGQLRGKAASCAG